MAEQKFAWKDKIQRFARKKISVGNFAEMARSHKEHGSQSTYNKCNAARSRVSNCPRCLTLLMMEPRDALLHFPKSILPVK